MAKRIVVKQTRIEIEDYNIGDNPKLEYFFTIQNMVTREYYFKGVEYISAEKKFILPRGVDIHWLEMLLGVNAVLDTNCDQFCKLEEPIMLKYLPRNDVQKEALRFLLGKGEYTQNLYKSQLCVNLNTGVGKTFVSVAKASCDNVRAIMITSSTDWINQWTAKLQEYTNLEAKDLYTIIGSQSIYNITSGRKDISKYKFILASHDTIKSYASTNGWEAVSELFKILNVGIKIYDEAHLYFDNICKIDFYTNTYQTIYLTATPNRSSEKEDDIYQLYFKNVPAIDLFDEETDPHTKYLAIRYNSNPNPKQISECKNQYGLDRNKYTGYVVNKDEFYNILRIILEIVKRGNDKVLMYIGTNIAIETVYQWMVHNYPEYADVIGIYTSVTPKEIKDEQLRKRFILSTTKSCGAAMDIQHLKYTIVLAEPFKSGVIARQTLGRTRDKNTLYIELVDNGFLYTKKYYAAKKDIFSKYALDCKEMNLTTSQIEDKVREIVERREKYSIPVIKHTKDSDIPFRARMSENRIMNTDYSTMLQKPCSVVRTEYDKEYYRKKLGI